MWIRPRHKIFPEQRISMNHALFNKLSQDDFDRIEKQLREDLENYYADMGGL